MQTLKNYDLGETFSKVTGGKDTLTLRDVEKLANEIGAENPSRDGKRVFMEIDRGNKRSVSWEEFQKVLAKVEGSK